MPRIHVIYDANDRIDPPSGQVQKQLGAKIAIMSVDAAIERKDIIKVVSALATLLLKQLVAGEPN